MAQAGGGPDYRQHHPSDTVRNDSEWELIFGSWSDIGDQYRLAPAGNDPLPQHDIDYLNVFKGVTFGRSLGAGGFGAVFETTLDNPPGIYACKIIALSRWERRYSVYEAVEALLKEGNLLSRLNHEHIVSMHRVMRVYDRQPQPREFPKPIRILIFMDLCDGTLKQFIERSLTDSLNERVSLQWLAQISDALRYLHNNERVAHLDIKPENILFKYEQNNQNRVMFKLADLGLAVHNKNVHNRAVGTSYYMAPEVSIPRGYNPYKADIYSLGKSFAESMAGYDRRGLRQSLPDFQLKFNRFIRDMANYSPTVSQQWNNVSQLVAELVCSMTNRDPNTRCSIDDVCNNDRIRPHRSVIGRYFDHRPSPLD